MKQRFTIPISFFLILIDNLLFGQEKPDSIDINSRINTTFIHQGNTNIELNLNETEFFPEIEKRWKKYIFQDKTWTQFKLEDGVKKLPDGRLYLTYTSANQALYYFTTYDPVSLQFDFHLKPLTHWEKIDIYFFGDGMLFNSYPDNGTIFTGLPTKEFLWEAGGGIEYEVSKNLFLFYEFGGLFKNQKFKSIFHKGGIRYLF